MIHALSAWKISNGLIENVIDFAFLWPPRGTIRLRFLSSGEIHQTPQGEHNPSLPTYAWLAWHGPVTCQTNILEGFNSLVDRSEMVTPGNKTRHVVRYGQNNKTTPVVGYSTLVPAPPYAPQDCFAYKDIMQNLHWAKPMVLSLAYRTRLVNYLRGGNTGGPGILHFKSLPVMFLLSSTVSEYQSTNDKGCQRVWLLDKSRRRVGTA